MKGWRTGTSAESWALRRQGRYKEADALLLARAANLDVEALITLYSLHYPGSASYRHHGSDSAHISRLAAGCPGQFEGHPVAKVMWHPLRNRDCAAVHQYALETGHRGALFQSWIQCGNIVPASFLQSLSAKDDPELLAWVWLNGYDLRDAKDFVFLHRHPVIAWDLARRTTKGIEEYWSEDVTARHSEVLPPLEAENALRETVRLLQIAADQGHLRAEWCLAKLRFNPRIPADLRSVRQGALLLRDVLLRSYGHDDQLHCFHPTFALRIRPLSPLIMDADRIYELYCYGKAWGQLPKAETFYPTFERCKDQKPFATAMGSSWLGDSHPRRVVWKVDGNAKSSLITFIGCLRRRIVPVTRPPRDIVELITRLVWSTRHDDCGLWWWGQK